jgi:hypothetical protein
MFKFKEGYSLSGVDEIHEAYHVLRNGMWGNISRDFLQEAVKYFKIRLEAGDNFTDGVLRRAERELAQLQTEKKN